MDVKAQFVEVVAAAATVPAPLATHAADVRGCEISRFDESYIEFLDTQIRLCAQGPEWNQRLIRRRAVLSPYCGVRLIRGSVRVDTAEYTIYVDPQTSQVVHWEEYSL